MPSPSRLTIVAAILAALFLVPTASAAPHKGRHHAQTHARARLHVSSQTSTQQPASTEVQAEGTITAVSPTSLTIQLHESSSSMTFVVPAGFDLGGAQVGDLADAKGTQAADGTITLTELEVQAGEHGAPPAQGTEVEAEGTITAVSPTSVTIQQHEGGASVTFAVPAGFDLGGAQVGDSADAKGLQAADGTITLTELEVQGSGSGDQGDQQQQSSGDQGDQQQQSSGDQGGGGGQDGSGD